MSASDKVELEFTGERFIPEVEGQIAMEHIHRYYFAAGFCNGKRVIDAACGEGYGSAILSNSASSVVGVDISPEAVSHAVSAYHAPTLKFTCADVTALPFDENEFDVFVSFETIEHHDRHQEMMLEVRRVLKPGGVLVISSPDKLNYSIKPKYTNPFHVKELLVEEFMALVAKHFRFVRVYGQRVTHGSLIVNSEASSLSFKSYRHGDGGTIVKAAGLAEPLYDIIVASDEDFDPPENSFYEREIHGMLPAEFYSQHVMGKLTAVESELKSRDSHDLSIVNQITQDVRGSLAENLDSIAAGLATNARVTERVSDEIQALHSTQQSLANEISPLMRLLELKESDVKALEKRLEDARSDADRQKYQIGSLQKSKLELESEVMQAQNQILEALRREKESEGRLESELSSVKSEMRRLVEQDTESRQKVAELKESLDVAIFKLTATTEELAAVNSKQCRNEAKIRILRNSFWWRIGRLDRLFRDESNL